MNLYGVVTMDLVGSRKLMNRSEIQNKLDSYIKNINSKYSSILVAPIDFTTGDEWQLITNKPYECYEFVHEFQQLFWFDEIKFYSGIGIGTLSTKIYENTRKMDGSCFIAARQAIDIAKKKSNIKTNFIHSNYNRVFFQSSENIIVNNKNKSINKKTINFQIPNEEVAITSEKNNFFTSITFNNTINTIIENTEILKEKMTHKQKETYISYKKIGSYRKMIDKDPNYFNDSISAISQRLNAANYFTIENNHIMIKALLYEYCKLNEV